MCTACILKLQDTYKIKQGNMSVLLSATDVNQKTENTDVFENNYQIQQVLNPETGRISYMLNNIKDETNEDQQIYTIDLKRGTILDDSGNDICKRRYKRNVNKDCESVKENKPNKVEEEKTTSKAPESVLPFTLLPGQTTCPICERIFPSTTALSRHMNTHYPNFLCSACGAQFASKLRLRAHNKVHHNGCNICKECQKEFTNVNTYTAHMWRLHGDGKPFKCRCGASYSTFLQRLRHAQEAHGEGRQYPCPLCDSKFAYAACRTKHIRAVHIRDRPHKCPHCPMSFPKRSALNAHLANRHGVGEKKHPCSVCGQRFYLASALRFHEKNIHRDKAPPTPSPPEPEGTPADTESAVSLEFVTSLHMAGVAHHYEIGAILNLADL